jgi:predicted ATPase
MRAVRKYLDEDGELGYFTDEKGDKDEVKKFQYHIKILFNENGLCLPDGQVSSWVNSFLRTCSEDCVLVIGSVILLNEFRIRVRRGEIPHNNLVLCHTNYEGEVLNKLYVNKYGHLDMWPNGFADIIEKQLMELI